MKTMQSFSQAYATTGLIKGTRMSYSEYGLNNDKRAFDPGEHGGSLCLWCWQYVPKGMSLCFSNFCICPGCTEKGLEAFAAYEASGEHPGIGLEVPYNATLKEMNENQQQVCFGSSPDNVRVNWGITKDSLLVAKRVLLSNETT